MKIECAAARLLLTPRELQVRLQNAPVVMSVLVDDIRLLATANLLLADAGAVRWQLTLDTPEQLQIIGQFYGITPE
ncbi:DUF3389 family protein [Shewanella sp. YIC-542]|uniref:DUF3389 family protein n=1 Tax=Shewanella mytili TaxID=3377111 RepID=UPI00398EFD4F